MIQVKQLFSHPVKGLTPQALDQVDLRVGYGVLGDRAFALMYDTSDPETADPIVPWTQKKNLAMQCDRPELAALACEYDAATGVLTVRQNNGEVLVADTNAPGGRTQISHFFSDYLSAVPSGQSARYAKRRRLRLVGSGNGTTRYPDREPIHLSLLSAATLEHLSQVAGQPIDARRFRPNIVVEGVPAWEEFNWSGQEFDIGTARILITERLSRCPNIDVHPDKGELDIPLFSLIQNTFKHKDTGVVAKVITDGTVVIGDELIGRADQMTYISDQS